MPFSFQNTHNKLAQVLQVMAVCELIQAAHHTVMRRWSQRGSSDLQRCWQPCKLHRQPQRQVTLLMLRCRLLHMIDLVLPAAKRQPLLVLWVGTVITALNLPESIRYTYS
jgi:hypothetical protein